MTVNMSKEEGGEIPEEHRLCFPPFPPGPIMNTAGEELKPFNEYETKGVNVPVLPAGQYTDEAIRRGMNGWEERVTQNGTDAQGQPFVKLNVDRTPEGVAAARAARQRAYNDRHRNRMRVSLNDSWKLGNDPSFEEPQGTCIENYDM